MTLVGIIAKKKDIQAIKKELKHCEIEIIEITPKSVQNIKNINFEEIIINEDIILNEFEYQYMREILSKTKYLIINCDIEIDMLKKIKLENPIKTITYGFNSKATITISSVKDEKILVCLQRDIQKVDGKIIEAQEKIIYLNDSKSNKIYNELVVFIVKELHNL